MSTDRVIRESRFMKYYPFSPGGTALLVAAVYLLGRGYAEKNFTALFLSFTALSVLGLLVLLGRLQAIRLGRTEVSLVVPAYTYTQRLDREVSLDTGGVKSFLFFRIHAALFIREKVGRSSFVRLYREGAFTGEKTLSIPLLFPLSGQGELTVRLRVSDIFGLSRSRFHGTMESQTVSLPVLLPDKMEAVQAEGGMETRARQKSADEEKYYMREYIPGDKMRDINWKASSRNIDVFTRISPVSQEETRILYIDFRHFSPERQPNRDGILHLDFLKSWFMSFLWSTKRDNPDFLFDIVSGKGRILLEREDDIIKMGFQLGSLFYQSDPGYVHEYGETNEVYIFSTPYDATLGRVLQNYAGMKIHLFRTDFDRKHGTEQRELSVMRGEKGIFLPGPWALRKESRFRNAVLPSLSGSHVERLKVTVV